MKVSQAPKELVSMFPTCSCSFEETLGKLTNKMTETNQSFLGFTLPRHRINCGYLRYLCSIICPPLCVPLHEHLDYLFLNSVQDPIRAPVSYKLIKELVDVSTFQDGYSR